LRATQVEPSTLQESLNHHLTSHTADRHEDCSVEPTLYIVAFDRKIMYLDDNSNYDAQTDLQIS
jgi:hypothetical protein